MRLFRRKPEPSEEEKQLLEDWDNKVWSPLHFFAPKASDKQAMDSLIAWGRGERRMSFLIASEGRTTRTTRSGDLLRERWEKMNPGEDFDAFMNEIGQSSADHLDQHPEALE